MGSLTNKKGFNFTTSGLLQHIRVSDSNVITDLNCWLLQPLFSPKFFPASPASLVIKLDFGCDGCTFIISYTMLYIYNYIYTLLLMSLLYIYIHIHTYTIHSTNNKKMTCGVIISFLAVSNMFVSIRTNERMISAD